MVTAVTGEAMNMGATLSIFSWNVQSPGPFGGSADPDVLAELLKGFTGYDIYAFCEVLDQQWANGFKAVLEESEGDEFTSVLGTTGWGGDKLLVLYRTSTLQKNGDPQELMDMKEGGGRAPLVVPLRLKPDGAPFLFVMNHLHSSSNWKRLQQAQELNEWASNQTDPIIAAGDYNFFDVRPNGMPETDHGFRLLTAHDVFSWVRPAELTQTQFDPHWDIDWILDFIFVAGEAKTWEAEAKILLADKPRAYFLTDAASDHRPVVATFSL